MSDQIAAQASTSAAAPATQAVQQDASAGSYQPAQAQSTATAALPDPLAQGGPGAVAAFLAQQQGVAATTDAEKPASASEPAATNAEPGAEGAGSNPEPRAGDPKPETEEATAEGTGESEAQPGDTPEIAQARKILAAAQRKEERALAARREMRGLEEKAAAFEKLREIAKTDPKKFIELGGFSEVNEFIQAIIDSGADKKPPAVEDRVKALEDEIRERDEKEAEARKAATIERALTQAEEMAKAAKVKRNGAEVPRYRLATNTNTGRDLLRRSVLAHYQDNPKAPDSDVYRIADNVEKYLREDMGTVTAESDAPRRPPALAPKSTSPAATSPTPSPPAPATLAGLENRTTPDMREEDLPLDPKLRLAALMGRYTKAMEQ